MHGSPNNIKRRLTSFLIPAVITVVLAGASVAVASLTLSGSGVTGSSAINIDTTSTISIGASSATGITIGRTGATVTFPGNLTVSGNATATNLSVLGSLEDASGNFYTTSTAAIPSVYTFSVASGTVKATPDISGLPAYSGTDAAVVINDAIAADPTGGTFYFQNGIYPFTSVTQETTDGYNLYYSVGIPANAGSADQYATWRFVGEAEPSVVGAAVQTQGVIFQVTPTAITAAGSPTNVVVGFWQRPDTTNNTGNDIFFENLGLTFPNNQRGYEVGFDMEEADTVVWQNTVASFNASWGAPGPNTTYSLPPNPTGANGSAAYRSPKPSHGDSVVFDNTWAVGYSIGYDIIGEHSIMQLAGAELCYWAAQYGGVNEGGTIQYEANWDNFEDQDNYDGILLGSELGASTTLDLINYKIEQDLTGPFARQYDMVEANPGNTSGMITYFKTDYGGGRVNTPNLFEGGGGQGEQFVTFNAEMPGIKSPAYFPSILYSATGVPLPSCTSTVQGETAVVRDAASSTYMGAYSSGGSLTAPVICSYNGATYSWVTY